VSCSTRASVPQPRQTEYYKVLITEHQQWSHASCSATRPNSCRRH